MAIRDDRLRGRILFRQEHRFYVADEGGVARLFVLSAGSEIQGRELDLLCRENATVVVRYRPAPGLLALEALRVGRAHGSGARGTRTANTSEGDFHDHRTR
jgi:hypothetical protein